jgi:hypothetical protein
MSRDMVHEDVPRFLRREGDLLVAGANNSTIVLGRDRLGPVDSGYGSIDADGAGKGAGAIHMSVGRSAEDPSIADDRATLYASAKTDPDTAAGTESIGQKRTAVSGIVMRADCLRLSARTDFKVSVGKAYITVDSSGAVVIEGAVSLGQDAAERIMRGDAFSKFWNTVTVPTPMGPSGPPPPIPESVFSPRNKVK